ncbi:MAG: serine/threonine-protein kinase [Isosphaeraceae bacterium]
MHGEKLGSFRIESTLGAGAMGVVYKAVNETTGKVAAVKVIHNEVGQKGKGYERFRREAEILQQFRHPNIVRFLALGRYKGTSYFAMEFVPGQTLDHILEQRGPLPWKEVAGLGKQICEALQYAHEHGVVHRDLKPSNLMLTANGQIKLTDFGIAKDLDATALTATGRTMGTAAYMATEQIRGTPAVSHKTDLYSLGVVLYQMLTGKLPFAGQSTLVMMHAHINSPIPRPSAKVHEIPRAVDDLIVQLMAKDPADRPWDAAAVGDTLTKVLDKASKGESVAMVWPTSDGSPTVDAPLTSPSIEDATRPKKKKGTKSGTGSRQSVSGEHDTMRRRLEVAGMIGALVAIAGLMAYILWPPSADYLYRKAEPLMASSKRSDWITAIQEYLDPLDQKHPDHPYKQQTQAFRDKVLLSDAQNRAEVLDSAVRTRLNRPNTDNERLFVEMIVQVHAAEQAFNEPGAIRIWELFGKQLKASDDDGAMWRLFSDTKIAELKRSIEQRRASVEKLIEKVAEARSAGNISEAVALQQQILSRFGQYAEVAESLGLPPGGATNPAPATSKNAEPTPTPETPTPNAGATPTPDPGADPGKSGP